MWRMALVNYVKGKSIFFFRMQAGYTSKKKHLKIDDDRRVKNTVFVNNAVFFLFGEGNQIKKPTLYFPFFL